MTEIIPFWTAEKDALLKSYWRKGLPAYEIAELIGASQAAVRGRADRLGIKFERQKTRARRANKNGEGHKPFTDRCGEIMRAHGVKI